MKRRLAIIPARGGSKRIPNKNIKYFLGKPVISYIISAAYNSGIFTKIHVSTDSLKVKEVVEKIGMASIDFLRPESISDDHTPLMPVLKFVVEKFEIDKGDFFDEVWLLMPCAPLVTANDLINASIFYDNKKTESQMLAVSELPVPYEWIFKLDSKKNLSPLVEGGFAIRSQDLNSVYYDCGIFYAYPINLIKNSIGAGSDQNLLGFIYPKFKSVDIDNMEDWNYAEKLYKVNQLDNTL